MLRIDTNADEVAAALEKVPRAIEQSVSDKALPDYLKIVQTKARREHRYDRQTGRLDRAIKISHDKDGGSVYIDDSIARYGKYVHEGTKRWASDPFLTNAVDSTRTQMDAMIDRAVDSAISNAGF
jgi:HK97 gp10 family phage protein